MVDNIRVINLWLNGEKPIDMCVLQCDRVLIVSLGKKVSVCALGNNFKNIDPK